MNAEIRWAMRMAVLAVLVGCQPAEANPCGEGGASYSDDVGRYCAYGVIEGGFQCPLEMPFEFEFPSGATLCADWSAPPDELPSDACVGLGFTCDQALPQGQPGVDGGTADGGPQPLPAGACAPACVEGGPPAPPGSQSPSTCYDGCNWCYCTTAGPINCTARVCDAGFAGFPDSGFP